MSQSKISVEAYPSPMITTDAHTVFVLDSGQSFRGHKGLLSARSQYLKAMFESGMVEASSGTVRVRDCACSSFEAFLQVKQSINAN